MAYIKKTWKNRQSEYPNRRKLVSVGPDTYDVSREEGLVFDEGDAFNQANMNDLEARIEQGFEQEGVKTLTHSKVGTVHTPGNLPTAPGLYSCQFIATADYNEGDSWAGGYTAKPTGEETVLPDKAFVAGDLVTLVADTGAKKLGFDKMGGKFGRIVAGGIQADDVSQVRNVLFYPAGTNPASIPVPPKGTIVAIKK